MNWKKLFKWGKTAKQEEPEERRSNLPGVNMELVIRGYPIVMKEHSDRDLNAEKRLNAIKEFHERLKNGPYAYLLKK